MFQPLRQLAREVSALAQYEDALLSLSRRHFAEANRLERTYAQYEAPAYLRRQRRIGAAASLPAGRPSCSLQTR